MKTQTKQQYLVYRKSTGQILGSFGSVRLKDGEQHASDEDIRRRMRYFGAADVDDVDYLVGEIEHPGRRMQVDVASKKVIEAHHIRLRAGKSELEGDGQDSVEIEIDVLGSHDKHLAFDGELLVTTSRGRLSERGGRVKITHGSGRVRLTSVAETVNRVDVAASDATGLLVPGHLTLSFV